MKKLVKRLVVAAVVLFPLTTQAAGLAPRSAQLGSSAPGVVTSYDISFTTATASSIGSIGFEFCTTSTGGCTLPTGLLTTAATLVSQSGAIGFSIVNGVNGKPYIARIASAVGSGVALSYTLGHITNPSTTPNLGFFVRVTTYAVNDDVTGPVDSGTVAVDTVNPVQLTGVTPPILVFCVGESIIGNCTSVTGSAIDFGDFSPLSTSSGSSVMQAQTNAANGYTIVVTGTTLASGVNFIPQLTSQTSSVIGTSQFGLNLRQNTIPAVGTDPTGLGSGTYAASYASPNQFRFDSGDIVASALAPTDVNTYTSSYMINIGGTQAAGVYTATMTYICTASF